jgi:hypothetical protein
MARSEVAPRLGWVAVAAAVTATAGDLLLLWVANAARPEFTRLVPPPPGALPLGTYLGVLAIPVYAAGYWDAGRGLGPRAAARWVFALGAAAAALGAVVHGMTGLVLHFERLQGTSGASPEAVVMRHGLYLVPLWGALAVLSVVGSAVWAITIRRGGTAYPRWLALANPVCLILTTSLVAAPWPDLAAFLGPAGPNVAHVVFFALATTFRGATSTVTPAIPP